MNTEPARSSSSQTSDSIEGIVSDQLKRLLRLSLVIYVPILLGLVALVVVHIKTGIPLRYFFIDPVSEFNAPMYIGLLSNFGVLLWCATATVCCFGGWLLLVEGKRRDFGWFLVCAGLITSLLMLDDLYLLHEEVLPDHLFVPQKLVFVMYGGLVLSFLVYFRKMILQADFLILVVAFCCFAASVLIDLFVTPEEFQVGNIPGRHIIEDGFKLLGIVSWAFFFIRTSIQHVRPAVERL